MKTFTQNPLLKHQHLQAYIILVAKMIFHKKKHRMHKVISIETKFIWELKDTFTNQNWSMRLWVPKLTCWDLSL